METDTDLTRAWKEFGKHTEAGKMLYNLFGVKFRPDQFVNYPKLKLKSQEEKEEEIYKNNMRAKSSSKVKAAASKIDYSLPIKNPKYKFSKVDFIPKRKKEAVIKTELENIKSSMIDASSKNKNVKMAVNRKAQIEKLQDRFQFQERTVMPKGARFPGVKHIQTDENITEEQVCTNVKKKYNRNDKREELDHLYNQVLKEIDERYVYMGEIKALGKDMDLIIMGEIKERIDELKKIQKMIDEYDKKNNC
jgi:hypothetical protein